MNLVCVNLKATQHSSIHVFVLHTLPPLHTLPLHNFINRAS